MSGLATNVLHIEPIGIPDALFAKTVPEKEIAALIGAVFASAQKERNTAASADPTPEEMLAIGIAIGLQQATDIKATAPKISPWKLAARMRMM